MPQYSFMDLGTFADEITALAFVVAQGWDIAGAPVPGMRYFDSTENVEKRYESVLGWVYGYTKFSNVISVSKNGNDALPEKFGYLTIGAALTAAVSGDRVQVSDGTYIEDVDAKANVTIDAPGAVLTGALTMRNGAKACFKRITKAGAIDLVSVVDPAAMAYLWVDEASAPGGTVFRVSDGGLYCHAQQCSGTVLHNVTALKTLVLVCSSVTGTLTGKATLSCDHESLSNLSAKRQHPLNALYTSASVKTADYVITDTDGLDAIYGDTTLLATIAITLPNAVNNVGRLIRVMKVDSNGFNVVVLPTSPNTIDGLNDWFLRERDHEIWVESDGTNWRIVYATIPDSLIFRAFRDHDFLINPNGPDGWIYAATPGGVAPTACRFINGIYRVIGAGAGGNPCGGTIRKDLSRYYRDLTRMAAFTIDGTTTTAVNDVIIGCSAIGLELRHYPAGDESASVLQEGDGANRTICHKIIRAGVTSVNAQGDGNWNQAGLRLRIVRDVAVQKAESLTPGPGWAPTTPADLVVNSHLRNSDPLHAIISHWAPNLANINRDLASFCINGLIKK